MEGVSGRITKYICGSFWGTCPVARASTGEGIKCSSKCNDGLIVADIVGWLKAWADVPRRTEMVGRQGTSHDRSWQWRRWLVLGTEE